MSYDGFFGEFDVFNSDFNKIIQRMMRELEKAAKNRKLKGRWEINEIDTNGAKGYAIQGRFGSNQPWKPLDPFNPLKPVNPMRPQQERPQRPFEFSDSALKEADEPLTDLFEDEKTIRIYFELRGVDKDDVQLNVTAGKVEVKAKDFYKMVNLPTSNIDLERASSKYRNGVLEVTIPKKDKTMENDKRTIKID